MEKSKLVKANEKIAETVVGGYKKVEGAVVGGYKKMEGAVVGGYKKMEDAFVGHCLTHEGETVDEAKVRIKAEQVELQAKQQKQRNSLAVQAAGAGKRTQGQTMDGELRNGGLK